MATRSFTDVFPSNELVFHGPFDKSPVIFIKVKNTSTDEYVGFKVKTTAPTFYTVRPNKFYLQPGGVIDVQVTFSPRLKKGEVFKPPHNHKFLIQAIKTPDNSQNISDYIAKNPENVHSYRMKCSFIENPEDASKQQMDTDTKDSVSFGSDKNVSSKNSKYLSINNDSIDNSTTEDSTSLQRDARTRSKVAAIPEEKQSIPPNYTSTTQTSAQQPATSVPANSFVNDRYLIYIFVMLVTIILLVMSEGSPFSGYFSKE